MDYELIYDTRNSWTTTQEKLLQKWYKEAIALNWKHAKAAHQYFFIDRLIGIPTVAANAMTGTAVFLNLDTKGQCENDIIIQSVIGSIIILTAIFMAIQNFLRLAETGEKHNSSSARYKNFANSIESELVLPREDRLNGKIFIKQAQKRFNELFEICPSIPQRIEKSYKKHIKNMDSLECGDLTDIIINQQKIVRSIKSKNADDDNTSDDNTSDDNSDDNTSNDNSDIENADDGSDSNSEYNKSLQKEVDEEVKRIRAHERMNNMQRLKSYRTIDKFVNYF